MCERCVKPIENKQEISGYDAFYGIYNGQLVVIDDYSGRDFTFEINYCPECGREL